MDKDEKSGKGPAEMYPLTSHTKVTKKAKNTLKPRTQAQDSGKLTSKLVGKAARNLRGKATSVPTSESGNESNSGDCEMSLNIIKTVKRVPKKNSKNLKRSTSAGAAYEVGEEPPCSEENQSQGKKEKLRSRQEKEYQKKLGMAWDQYNKIQSEMNILWKQYHQRKKEAKTSNLSKQLEVIKAPSDADKQLQDTVCCQEEQFQEELVTVCHQGYHAADEVIELTFPDDDEDTGFGVARVYYEIKKKVNPEVITVQNRDNPLRQDLLTSCNEKSHLQNRNITCNPDNQGQAVYSQPYQPDEAIAGPSTSTASIFNM